MDYTVKESGLQLDQPPAIGNISSLVVVIQKNDNAEGVLEFREDFVSTTGKSQSQPVVNNCLLSCVMYNVQVRKCAMHLIKRLCHIIIYIGTL